MQAKRADNEIARLKNSELEHELEILERYAETLQDNIQDMLKDYHSQFDTLNSTVDSNNVELDKLRDEISTAQSSYNELRVQQCGLESEVDILRSRHQLTLGLNENLRL